MPTTCVAYGCNAQYEKGSKLGFFRFPNASRDPRRREAWIKAVRRLDDHGRPWAPSSGSRLCGNHFETGTDEVLCLNACAVYHELFCSWTGRPRMSPRHPDFVPSLFSFSCKKAKRASAVIRFQRAMERATKKKLREQGSIPSGTLASAVQGGGDDDMDIDGDSEGDLHGTQSQQSSDYAAAGASSNRSQNECDAVHGLLLLQTAATETSDINDIQASEERCPQSSATLLQENLALKKEVQKWKVKYKKLERRTLSVDNIDPTSFKFYTGLANRGLFDALYNHVLNNANIMQYWDCAEKKKGRK
ncbi:uncharacterized protein LOC144130077 isoform X1 [Amblyomma americanum]